MQSTKKLYKHNGTPVFVHFGIELQRVYLTIDDWQQELKDIWAAHLQADNSGAYELPIYHGISCKCCTKIIIEPYSRSAITAHEVRRPGRPRLRARR
jgi:hypothetical protein